MCLGVWVGDGVREGAGGGDCLFLGFIAAASPRVGGRSMEAVGARREAALLRHLDVICFTYRGQNSRAEDEQDNTV